MKISETKETTLTEQVLMLVRFNSKKYAQLEDLSCFTFLFATVSDSLIVDFG